LVQDKNPESLTQRGIGLKMFKKALRAEAKIEGQGADSVKSG